MLYLYPSLLEKWEKEQYDEIKNFAKENSDGDPDVELSISHSELRRLDIADELPNLFYQACLIVAFSHFESTICKLANTHRKQNTQEQIQEICEKSEKTLSKEAKEAKEWIENEAKMVRNNLCHNNSGTAREAKLMKHIAMIEKGVIFEDGMISITTPDYTSKFLEKSKILLDELCNMTGHSVKNFGKQK